MFHKACGSDAALRTLSPPHQEGTGEGLPKAEAPFESNETLAFVGPIRRSLIGALVPTQESSSFAFIFKSNE